MTFEEGDGRLSRESFDSYGMLYWLTYLLGWIALAVALAAAIGMPSPQGSSGQPGSWLSRVAVISFLLLWGIASWANYRRVRWWFSILAPWVPVIIMIGALVLLNLLG